MSTQMYESRDLIQSQIRTIADWCDDRAETYNTEDEVFKWRDAGKTFRRFSSAISQSDGLEDMLNKFSQFREELLTSAEIIKDPLGKILDDYDAIFPAPGSSFEISI